MPGLKPIAIPLLSDIPLLGPVLFKQDAVVYLSIVAYAGVAWTLSKTRLGLLLKAVGESPEAAHAIGYPVILIRFGAVAFGGAMAGIAGAYLSDGLYAAVGAEHERRTRLDCRRAGCFRYVEADPGCCLVRTCSASSRSCNFTRRWLGIMLPVQFLCSLALCRDDRRTGDHLARPTPAAEQSPLHRWANPSCPDRRSRNDDALEADSQGIVLCGVCSGVLLDRRNELVVDVPGEIDPLVLAELLDAEIDDFASHRLGVQRGKVGFVAAACG